MDVATLSPSRLELHLDGFEVEARSTTIPIAVRHPVARCPSCGQLSDRIHSRYSRTLSDLPWRGIAVRLRLRTRKFFCCTPGCAQKIFTERLPQTIEPYGRKTLRLEGALRLLSFFLGGEAGARLSGALGMLSCPDKLRRRAEQAEDTDPVTPCCLGIDDRVWRQGQCYGTRLCGLESGRIVDLLRERTAEAVVVWLRAHPGVEIISRDRGRCLRGRRLPGCAPCGVGAGALHRYRR